jgi:hypothetical protein
VAREQCEPSRCEDEAGCGVSSGEITPLTAGSTMLGLAYDGTSLFVLERLEVEFRLKRLSWPALEPIVWFGLANAQFLGDPAVLDGFMYVPDKVQTSIARVDLTSGKVTELPSPALEPTAVAADGDALWVSADGEAKQLFRISLAGELLGQVANTVANTGCGGLEATSTGLWCLDREATTITKISKEDGSVLAGPFFVPPRVGLTLIDGQLWAGSDGSTYAGSAVIAPPVPSSGIGPLELRGVTP